MPANFTSGWLGHNEQAWHGLGVVTEGTLPARTAFETAEALFTVEKRPLYYLSEGMDGLPTEHFGLVRTDSEALLGIVSKQYEIVQNDSLLRMAEFLREEVIMDSVVVLEGGGKVAFTAQIKGAEENVLPGDTVHRRIVGYLGHDGKTGCGAIFTNVRVVCSNTLAAAMGDTGHKRSIRHKNGANENFDSLIQSIDVARQSFHEEVEMLQSLTEVKMSDHDFRAYLEMVYAADLQKTIKRDGVETPKTLDDLRKTPHLMRAFRYGLGTEIPGVKGTLYGALNAVTEVETSTKIGTKRQRDNTFNRANFGQGLILSRRAVECAKDYALAC